MCVPISHRGVPGYKAESIHAMGSPARTPQPILARLHQEVVKVLTTPENRERFLNSGAEVVASTPEVLAAEIRSEVTRLEKIFKGAGIREN